MKKCKWHTLGQYHHSSSELAPFCCQDDIDGLGFALMPIFYKFCPECGTRITKSIVKRQMAGKEIGR